MSDSVRLLDTAEQAFHLCPLFKGRWLPTAVRFWILCCWTVYCDVQKGALFFLTWINCDFVMSIIWNLDHIIWLCSFTHQFWFGGQCKLLYLNLKILTQNHAEMLNFELLLFPSYSYILYGIQNKHQLFLWTTLVKTVHFVRGRNLSFKCNLDKFLCFRVWDCGIHKLWMDMKLSSLAAVYSDCL